MDNVLIPGNVFDFIYHVGSYFNMHSIIASELIAGGRIHGRDRQTEFFTAADPMDKNWVDQGEEHDPTQPRYAAYKHVWKVTEYAVYWVDVGRVQKMRLESTRQDRMPLFFMTLYRQYALKGWYPGETRESSILEFQNIHDLLLRLPFKQIGEQMWILMWEKPHAAAPNQLNQTNQHVRGCTMKEQGIV